MKDKRISTLRLTACIVALLTAASLFAAQPPKSWQRTDPLSPMPKHATNAHPLSDQPNNAGWTKYEPMTDEFLANTTIKDKTLAEKIFQKLDANRNEELNIPEYLRTWGKWARQPEFP